MASSAVKQPAVFGRYVIFLGSMKSISRGCVGSEMFTRRTATVTISAPEASTAAAFCSRLLYLPVPTIRRDVKVRPATLQQSALMSCCAVTQPPPTKCTISKSSPSSTQTSVSVDRGTISRLRSTATRAGSRPRPLTISAIVTPPATRRCSPLIRTERLPSRLIGHALRTGTPQRQACSGWTKSGSSDRAQRQRNRNTMAENKDRPGGAGAMRIDPALVRELAELLSANALTEIEVEDGDRRIKVKREAPSIISAAAAP